VREYIGSVGEHCLSLATDSKPIGFARKTLRLRLEYRASEIAREIGGHQPPRLNTT